MLFIIGATAGQKGSEMGPSGRNLEVIEAHLFDLIATVRGLLVVLGEGDSSHLTSEKRLAGIRWMKLGGRRSGLGHMDGVGRSSGAEISGRAQDERSDGAADLPPETLLSMDQKVAGKILKAMREDKTEGEQGIADNRDEKI